mmetsp:Transcript_46607/g.107643  ORF Transcript_46607/g.107643 Transcript_46607/m.107643 type:complete len:297 (+) Transcript_46607:60-950(+)
MPKNNLTVLVKSAKNLKDRDGIFSGKSDPYVRLRIVADDDHTQVVHLKETKTKNGTHNPVWNEKISFANLETPGAYTLKVNVLDKDYLTRDDPLGETTIDLGTLTDSPGLQDFDDVWIDGFVWKAYLSFSVSTGGGWGNGEGEKNSLAVRILDASGLRDADGFLGGKSDPYVHLTLTDAKGYKVGKPQQTTVKEEAGADPSWNEDFMFENLEKPSSYRLRLDVYDKDRYTRDDALGSYVLHLGLLKHSEEYADFDVKLKGSKGNLRFSVSTNGGWGHSKVCIAESKSVPCTCCLFG